MPKLKRSLYQCFNAKVKGDIIYCSKGYTLAKAQDGTVPVMRLKKGFPLEQAVCQNCPHYDEMGEPLALSERGWK